MSHARFTTLQPCSLLIAFALSGCFAKEAALHEQKVDAQEEAEAQEQDAGEGAQPPDAKAVAEEGVVEAPNRFTEIQVNGTDLQGTIGTKGGQRSFGGSGLGMGGGSLRIGGSAAVARGARIGRSHRFMPPSVQMESNAASEEYTDHGVNPFTLVAEDATSTFSIDVDTASYTMARRKLTAGVLPAWEGIRAEEFINFFDYTYESPRKGPFAVHMEAMPDPFRAGRHIMRVGVQAKRFTVDERPPLHLTFLVDVSGSMSSPDKLGLAKKSMHTLVENLRRGDTVAVATYAGRTARVLEPTGIGNFAVIHEAIDSLKSGGSTAMASGIEIAYDMADDAFERGAENRVVILSDGDANVGATSWESMLKQIKGYADQGITLSTIGYGQGNYRDTLMEQLANKGDGNNYYVDSARESDRVFGKSLAGTMITVARDTKVQVEFNPKAVESYRLIGYENRDIADKDFRNDRVDAGEVGSGHSVTALYEVTLADADATDLATVRLRWEKPGADKKADEREFVFGRSDLVDDSRSASVATRMAYAAATFAEVLRQSPHAADIDLNEVEVLAGSLAADKDGRELVRLIGSAVRLGAMDAQAGSRDE